MAKVKFNPSTGKVSFNPSTGKVAMAIELPEGDNCWDCWGNEIDLPNQLELTFSGITACSDCAPYLGQFYTKYSFNVDPNQTWTLTKTSSCVWRYDIVDCIKQDRYSDSECLSFTETIYWDAVLQVAKVAGGNIRILCGTVGGVFNSDWFTKSSGCINKSNIPNIWTDCDEELPDYGRTGINGTANLVEI